LPTCPTDPPSTRQTPHYTSTNQLGLPPPTEAPINCAPAASKCRSCRRPPFWRCPGPIPAPPSSRRLPKRRQ
jgi:hypothetical protein